MSHCARRAVRWKRKPQHSETDSLSVSWNLNFTTGKHPSSFLKTTERHFKKKKKKFEQVHCCQKNVLKKIVSQLNESYRCYWGGENWIRSLNPISGTPPFVAIWVQWQVFSRQNKCLLCKYAKFDGGGGTDLSTSQSLRGYLWRGLASCKPPARAKSCT